MASTPAARLLRTGLRQRQRFGQWQEPGWWVFWRTVGKDLWQEYSSDFPYWDGPA